MRFHVHSTYPSNEGAHIFFTAEIGPPRHMVDPEIEIIGGDVKLKIHVRPVKPGSKEARLASAKCREENRNGRVVKGKAFELLSRPGNFSHNSGPEYDVIEMLFLSDDLPDEFVTLLTQDRLNC